MGVAACLICRAVSKNPQGDPHGPGIHVIKHEHWCRHHVSHDVDKQVRLNQHALYCPGCHEIQMPNVLHGPRIRQYTQQFAKNPKLRGAGIVHTFSHNVRRMIEEEPQHEFH